ncbi:hypothetical protein [Streptomyces phytophilus]|uniref:hypothetical protein n=1 Tax=Streptomyces phytophilus TaxID=722715 RepID=UPI001C691731|nr:hypothetical protein [Streptomyces phytophilus]
MTDSNSSSSQPQNDPTLRSAEFDPTVRDVLEERLFPEGRGASRRTRRRAWGITITLGILASMGGFAASFAFDLWTTNPRAAAEREAHRDLDQEVVPFTTSITYDTDPTDAGFSVVLDRPLSPEEVTTLQATPPSKVWDLLRPLGGRLIHSSTYTTTFKMNIFSERAAQLSIVDMTPVEVTCTEPSAGTLVDVSGQGVAEYPGLAINLEKDKPQLVNADGRDQGQPFFDKRRIDLGGGLEPGGLRVSASTREQSCTWEILARYVDAQQNPGEVTLRDGDKPFLAEAKPQSPEQHWEAITYKSQPPYFHPCHEKPSHHSCPSN